MLANGDGCQQAVVMPAGLGLVEDANAKRGGRLCHWIAEKRQQDR